MRFHELDALRASAMLLGIVLHSLVFLMPDPWDTWPVQEEFARVVDQEVNPYVHGFLIIHGFRMPLFFLLSGFFTAMLWQRRGLWRLLDHRIKRIALPHALGAITVVPVCIWLWTTFEPEVFGELNLLYWPITWLTGVVDLGFTDLGFFHLWFLWHLLFLVAIFSGLVLLGVKFTSRAWWGLIPLVIVAMFLMDEPIVGSDTSATFIADPRVIAFYGIFFIFGAFYYQKGITAQRWWTVAIAPAFLIAYPGALYYLAGMPGDIETPSWDWLGTAVFEEGGRWFATSVLQAAYAWLMCFGMMGLFMWIAAKERHWVRYMSDSSYWLYLWHLPLVVFLQWALVDVEVSPHLKFVGIFTVVTAVMLVTYHWGVRYTPIGTLLNGKRTRASHSPPSPPPAGAPPVEPAPEAAQEPAPSPLPRPESALSQENNPPQTG